MIEAPDATPRATDESAARAMDGASPGPAQRLRGAMVTHRSDIAWLLVAEVLTGVALTLVLQLWRARPRIPLLYGGSDSNLVMMSIRNIIDYGWINESPRLGAPFGQELFDYPSAAGDSLHLLMIKVLGWVSQDPALVMNAFFVLGFLLSTLTAFIACRHFGVRGSMAAAGAVLFSFLPYHLLRGQAHLMLATYYGVPLAVVLVVRQWGRDPFVDFAPGMSIREIATSRRTLTAFAICLVVGTTGLYYAVFTLILLGAAGAVRTLTTRSLRPVVVTVALAAAVAAPIVVATIPNRLYARSHGNNEQVGQRGYAETEFYGLHISNLVLPVGGHRVDALADLRAETNESPVPGEGSEALGIFGAAGFLGLILVALRRLGGGREEDDVLSALSGVLVAILLVATIAGFSAIVAALGFTQIRAWNRASVFIGMLSIAAFAVGADRALSRIRPRSSVVPAVASMLVIALGVADQTTTSMVPQYEQTARAWQVDRAFITVLEDEFGGNDMFQLPYVPFPENPPVVGMVDYEHLRGYLHGEQLRWSYGGVKGREAEWQPRLLATEEPASWSELLAIAGFEAIWVDRAGYLDRGLAVETGLQTDLGPPVSIGGDGRFAVYDLRGVQQRLDDTAAAERSAIRDALLHPIEADFTSGAYDPENGSEGPFRWLRSAATLQLSNDGRMPRRIRVSFVADAAGWPTRGVLHVVGVGVDQTIQLQPEAVPVTIELSVPPGVSSLSFRTDAPRVAAPTDRRDLRVRLVGFSVVDAVVDGVIPI